MNISSFTKLLENPQQIDTGQTSELKEVISTFPYFQQAKAIFLKGLKEQDSFQYNQQLKKTAAYTTDRSVLFDFITSTNFSNSQNETSLEEIIVKDAEVIKNLHHKIDIEIQKENSEKKIIEKTPEETLAVGKPISFSINESHSFNQWLQLSVSKPIIREAIQKSKKDALIDTFIESNPKIGAIDKNSLKSSIVTSNNELDNSLMTETLAKVYIEQQKFENAIQAYKILCLKYPEKSGFFADQIKAIQLLQKNKS